MLNQLKSEVKKIEVALEKLEGEISGLGVDFAEEKKLKKVARMIYAKEINEDRRKIYETD